MVELSLQQRESINHLFRRMTAGPSRTRMTGGAQQQMLFATASQELSLAAKTSRV
jgi:hypothetical protein